MALSRHRFAFVVLSIALLSGCGRASKGPAPSQNPTPLVTAEDIEQAPGMSIEQLLMSRVPGLTVTRAPDGHFVLHLRGGGNSLYGEQEPLVVVNGIALEPMSNAHLASLNPKDIETIEVLRDAVTTAMYGARGANGVIVIKTKRSE